MARALADALATEFEACAVTDICSPFQSLQRRWSRRLTAGTSVASLIDVDYGSTLKWNNL